MSVRSYFVPRRVTSSSPRAVSDPLVASAIDAAQSGQVQRFHLPILAACDWRPGADWAKQVLDRENAAIAKKQDALLAAVGYDPGTDYYGVLDSSYPDHELIVSVARESTVGGPLEKWDGLDWGVAEVSPDGLEFVMLDRDVLVDVLDAISSGSAGVMLRPFNPKAWARDAQVIDYPILAAANPHVHTGVMVAFYPQEDVAAELAIPGGEPAEQIHLTLAYLGDTEEEPIDYAALQRAVAKWARRMGTVSGEIAGTGLFTAGSEPVTYASVDCPDLPEAREMLLRILASEGVRTNREHGYTPHMTLAYDDVDIEVPNFPLHFDRVVVKYGDDTQVYPLATPVTAAGGAGPDVIYAVVDEFDTNAVLDLIRVVPGPIAYRRSHGKWVKDQPMLVRLMGVDPPPVVMVAADQAKSVVAQVDAHDAKNPEPVTAAVPWDEDKYKRQGGKFAKKEGSSDPVAAKGKGGKGKPQGVGDAASAGIGHAVSAEIPRDLTDSDVGLGPHPGKGQPPGLSAADIRDKPWLLLGPGGQLRADLLKEDFWNKQPAGFRSWLEGFLRDERNRPEGGGDGRDKKPAASDDGRNEKGERTGEAKDGKRDVAKGEQRSQAAKDAQAKAAKAGGRKSGGRNLKNWMSRVPARYRAAMRAFISAAGQVADKDKKHNEDRKKTVTEAGKADRAFDLGFAKEGLGEARRRELFDRQIAGKAQRITDAGVNPRAAAAVIRRKVLEEKQVREAFERKRKLTAEQERVRRMQTRNRIADADADYEPLVAAFAMPAALKEHWVAGEGAARLRWGTSGDYGRCVRALAKYVPTHMVNGACANLHKLATGQWPGPGRSH